MNPIARWLRGRQADSSAPSNGEVVRADDPLTERIEQARSLARAGKVHDAARIYSKLSNKHGRPEIWLEHAALLLEIGDYFGAASCSARVLQVEPRNERALAIRRLVLEQDERDRKT